MSKFGDPGFNTHSAIGQFLTLLSYHMSSDDVIPFDVTNYVTQMNVYMKELKDLVASSGIDLDLSKLKHAIKAFKKSADALDAMKKKAEKSNDKRVLALVNANLRDFERGFVSQGGLPDREFYQHLIFAPGLDTG